MANPMTKALAAAAAGEPGAARKLLPLVYGELRLLAAAKLAQEPGGQTLQPTALVHEAYLRLIGSTGGPEWNHRGHFFAAAAEAMRRILVDNARRKQAAKRGGDLHRQELLEIAAPEQEDELLALDDALVRFAEVDPKAEELVKLRYFAGLTMTEAASAMNISERTAARLWTYARAWLRHDMEKPG